jgi:hypothetical protein
VVKDEYFSQFIQLSSNTVSSKVMDVTIVFRWHSVRISPELLSILIDDASGFLQSVQANSDMVPTNRELG